MNTYPWVVLLCCAFLSLPLRAQPVATSSAGAAEVPAPRIVCDEPVFDFGERDNSGVVEHHYPIRNAGTLPLELKQVYSTCGCTVVKPSETVIPPGGEASIQARFDLKGRTGPQVKRITVNSNDPKTPSLVMEIKGTALKGLHAEPASIFFGRVGPDTPRSRTFDIVSGRGPILIESYRTDQPGLILAQLPAEAGSDGSTHRFELTLAASLPEGNLNGSAFVKTDVADQPEIAIPVAAFIVPSPPPAPAAQTETSPSEPAVSPAGTRTAPPAGPFRRRDISRALEKLVP